MPGPANEQQHVWQKHASQWQHVGPPLRPTAEDGELLLRLCGPALAGKPASTIAVLGVTPEVVLLDWPAQSRLYALDHNLDMIDRVWTPHPRIPSSAWQSRWQAMPFEEHSVDLVVGDGALNVLPSLDDHAEVFGELHRVLRRDGLVALRCFIRPDRPEELESIRRVTLAGQVLSFHALKWRIAMALGEGRSVAVTEIHRAFEHCFPDREQLERATGWPRAVIATIDAYQNVDAHYNFPTLDALQASCAPWFRVVAIRKGQYELADRCPTLLFEPRGDPEAR